jgi:hypothetical protein
MEEPPPKGPVFTAGLIIAGSALLLYASTLGWYFTQIANGMSDAGETLSLTGVQVLGDSGGTVYNDSTTFTAVWLSYTGELYLTVAAIVVAGALVGFVAGALILKDRRRSRRRITSWLLVVSVVLAFTGPLLLLVTQPAFVCLDSSHIPPPLGSSPYGNSTGSGLCDWAVPLWEGSNSGYATFASSTPGPQTSFFGSEPFENDYSHTWGPSLGWYLAWIAAVVLLLGAWRHRQSVGAIASKVEGGKLDPGTAKDLSGIR